MTDTESPQVSLSDFIANRAKEVNISSKSQLVTVFGDVMSQHGGWVWLGSLIEALKPLGFSERLVRTSVFRLVQDDWLQTEKAGRRSFYSFTDTARRHYEKAARRIYADHIPNWDGRWLLVMPCYVSEPELTSFRRQLDWLGFAPLVNGVYAHPSFDQESLEETVQEMDLNEQVIIFSSKTLDEASADVLRNVVHDRWNIKQLEKDYQEFYNLYWPMYEQVKNRHLTDQQCFLLRVLLIHEYRRILLKDHELPKDMLPESWTGYAVHDLVRDFYARLAKPSTFYISAMLQNAEGSLPAANDSFWRRFDNEVAMKSQKATGRSPD